MIFNSHHANLIASGGVGVIPTDTIYGLVATVFDVAAVERIYRLKGRQPDKPFVIIIGDFSDLTKLGIDLTLEQIDQASKYWPGPNSLILPCPNHALAYLHRGTHSLAVRLPAHDALREFLRQTGPLVATSANPSGQEPAATIGQARACFGYRVDFYLDGGELSGPPSTLVDLVAGHKLIKRA